MYMRSRSWVSLEIIFMTCYASLLGKFLVWGHCLHLQGWVSESAWCSKLETSWELFMSGIFWMLFAVQGTSFPAKLLDGVQKVTFFICSFCNSCFGKTTRKCSSRLRIWSIADSVCILDASRRETDVDLEFFMNGFSMESNNMAINKVV